MGKPSQLVVGVAVPEDPAAVEFESLSKKQDPAGKTVRTVPAKFSLFQLLAIQRAVMDKYMNTQPSLIQGLGPDPVNGAVNVTIYRPAAYPPLQENPTVLEIAAKYGDAVEFEEVSSLSTATAD